MKNQVGDCLQQNHNIHKHIHAYEIILTNRHKIRRRHQIKQHRIIHRHKLPIPLLLHIPLKGIIRQGRGNFVEWFRFVMIEKFNNLGETFGFYLEDLDGRGGDGGFFFGEFFGGVGDELG